MNVLVLGCGYSGQVIGKRLTKGGIAVSGTTRSPDNFDGLSDCGISPLLFDGVTFGQNLSSAFNATTHLIVSIAPAREENAADSGCPTDPVLAAVGHRSIGELMPKLEWIGYLSTVGVYGDHAGKWVDETAPLKPISARSRQRVRAENEWINLAQACGLDLCIFRLSGIYGPGRNALRKAREERARRLVKEGQVFNRIHVDDIARATELAIERQAVGIFNITDDEPAPPQDVVLFAHDLLGLQPPPVLDFDKAEITTMARSFYGENKRVSNALSKSHLHMVYNWPNYRDALRRMHNENDW